MEIEVRARIGNFAEIKKALEIKARFLATSDEDDLYLRHASDTGRSLVLRIRKKEDGAMLTFKGKSTGDDTAWPDVDLPLSHPDNLEQLLLASGYVQVVHICKHRLTYHTDDFEINLDKIEDLGDFIEIEGRGDETMRQTVERDISHFLVSLGVQESRIIRKGYVPLMLEKIALTYGQ
jgi:adenylate cyclase class 2